MIRIEGLENHLYTKQHGLCMIILLNIISDAWKHSANLNPKCSFYDHYYIFKRKAIEWRKYIFGHLDRKLEDISSSMTQIQHSLGNSYSESAHNKLFELEKEHQFILKQKELYWKQRAPYYISWLSEGDNNTKFFHAYASHRRRRNVIQSIKLDNNEWVQDLKDIQQIFVEKFKELCSSNQTTNFSFNLIHTPQINISDHSNLIKHPNDLEILNARIGKLLDHMWLT